MADVWVVLALVAFFGACVAFVWACDRIIGPDELDETGQEHDDVTEPAVLG